MRPTSLTPKVANLWSGGANDWVTTRSLDAQGATLNLGTGATLCISLRRLRQKGRKVNSPMVRPSSPLAQRCTRASFRFSESVVSHCDPAHR